MTAAELVKRFPVIREWIAAGTVHLTALLRRRKVSYLFAGPLTDLSGTRRRSRESSYEQVVVARVRA
jgi:hypothetical protein